MEKPCKESITIQYYEYRKVIDYIENKYNIKTRNYRPYYKGKKEFTDSYLDFWHWCLDYFGNNISNDCYKTIFITELLDEYDDSDVWTYEIISLIYTEFQEDEMCFHICW